jgi:hypothetical protein
MDEQERKMLEEVVELSRKNNVMVRKLVRAHRFAVFLRIFYWVIIIGSMAVAYYSIQPYVSAVSKFFTGHDFSSFFNALPGKQ